VRKKTIIGGVVDCPDIAGGKGRNRVGRGGQNLWSGRNLTSNVYYNTGGWGNRCKKRSFGSPAINNNAKGGAVNGRKRFGGGKTKSTAPNKRKMGLTIKLHRSAGNTIQGREVADWS